MSGSSSTRTEIGSVADMVSRMRTVMPTAWFPLTAPDATASVTPVLDSLLHGIGHAWSFCHALTVFVRQQARIATATGGFLDMICADLFGDAIRRKAAEGDATFRNRIRANLLLPRATRAALSQTISTLAGQAPSIFEPSRAVDTGGYGGGSLAGAGGGGGYGTPGLAFGSISMPFQFLVSLTGTFGRTRRESQASFIDDAGVMRIAPRHVLRPVFDRGSIVGSLVEMRALNLIKDSLGWTGWSSPALDGSATWMVDPLGDNALLPGQPVLRMNARIGGDFIGPAVSPPLVAGPMTASIWIRVPSASQLQALALVVLDQTGTSQAPVDLSILDRWQRVSISSYAPDSFVRPLSMQIVGHSVTASTAGILTQCWQIEIGMKPTSYIPTAGQIGIREADDHVVPPTVSPVIVDAYGVNEAIRRVIPAGSTAWMAPIV